MTDDYLPSMFKWGEARKLIEQDLEAVIKEAEDTRKRLANLEKKEEAIRLSLQEFDGLVNSFNLLNPRIVDALSATVVSKPATKAVTKKTAVAPDAGKMVVLTTIRDYNGWITIDEIQTLTGFSQWQAGQALRALRAEGKITAEPLPDRATKLRYRSVE
jgi:hypothetical protein